LTPRRVLFTATGRRHVGREQDWWLEHRDNREIFAAELDDALRTLALLPGAGTPYPAAGIEGLRRLFLRKVSCHLYYTFNEDEIIVRAFWGARRHSSPRLKN